MSRQRNQSIKIEETNEEVKAEAVEEVKAEAVEETNEEVKAEAVEEVKTETAELINPKQAHNQKQIKKEAEARKKIRLVDEKILIRGNKKIKQLRYEVLVNGKYVKGNTKTIYLGKKNPKKGK